MIFLRSVGAWNSVLDEDCLFGSKVVLEVPGDNSVWNTLGAAKRSQIRKETKMLRIWDLQTWQYISHDT